MPPKPQISLLLRQVQRDIAEYAEMVARDSGGRSSARLAHLMAATDVALVAAEMTDNDRQQQLLLLTAYELGKALSLHPTPDETHHEDTSDFDTEP